MPEKKKILITGGAGFIGSNAAARYLERGNKVTILDNLSRKGTELNMTWLQTLGNIEFVNANIAEFAQISELMSNEFDVILHMAAQTAAITSIEEPMVDFNTNALGTLNLLECVRNMLPRFNPIIIYASTNKVYGNLEHMNPKEVGARYMLPGSGGVNERVPLDFHTGYGCSKGCADQYMRDYARLYNMKTVTFRQSCIYGPRQLGCVEQGWVAWFMMAQKLGMETKVYGDGKQTRDILYIDDLLDLYDIAVEKIYDSTGKIYNVGGGLENSVSLIEFFGHIARMTGEAIKPEYEDWRPGDQKVFVSSNSKVSRELGWKPQTSVMEGLDKLDKWIGENIDEVRKFVEIER